MASQGGLSSIKLVIVSLDNIYYIPVKTSLFAAGAIAA
jgi:hypothetical protein